MIDDKGSLSSFASLKIETRSTEDESCINNAVENNEKTVFELDYSQHSNEAAIDLKYGLRLSIFIFTVYFLIGIGYYHVYVEYSMLDTVFFLSTTFLGIGYDRANCYSISSQFCFIENLMC